MCKTAGFRNERAAIISGLSMKSGRVAAHPFPAWARPSLNVYEPRDERVTSRPGLADPAAAAGRVVRPTREARVRKL